MQGAIEFDESDKSDNNALLKPGFNNPVMEAQATFRKVLKAMSEPGLVQALTFLRQLNQLNSASFATLLTLVDNETTLWLSDAFADESTCRNLAFHCGCPITSDLSAADFVLADGSVSLTPDECKQGDPAWPDQSATVILQVAAMNSPDSGETFTLTGPGIETTRALSVTGLSAQWVEWLQHRQSSFPLGLDLILSCNHQLVALPRSTAVVLTHNRTEAL